MKKLIAIILLILLYCCESKAQYVNIPDQQFRAYLSIKYPGSTNTAGQLDTTFAAIVNEDSLNLEYYTSIETLEGLQYFKNLVSLMLPDLFRLTTIPSLPPALKYFNSTGCGMLQSLPTLPVGLQFLKLSRCASLTSLPNLPITLSTLDVSECHFTNFPVLPEQLSSFNCSSMDLLTIPELPNGLRWLECSVNKITQLPPLPDSLIYLSTNRNRRLTRLPALPNSLKTLRIVDCRIDSILSLPASLKNLQCWDCSSLRYLPALPPNLDTLHCGSSPIGELPSLPASLKFLFCAACQLVNLPALPGNLTFLNFSGNQITSVSSFPDSLKELWCGRTRLTTLPPLPIALTMIYCNRNQLNSLPQLPSNLSFIDCSGNQLSSLPPLPSQLQYINCSNNLLTNLPTLPTMLTMLNCYTNRLQHLPDLPAFLKTLICSDNQLLDLPELPTGYLTTLECNKNYISCIPKLPTPVGYDFLDVHLDDKVKCIPNKPDRVRLYVYNQADRIYTYSIPLCNPTNNINQCKSFPFMRGTVFYDTNGNNIKDAGELVKPNAKIYLSNNTTTFTNSNGEYEINTTDTGSFTLSLTPPTLYTVAPASYQHRFTSNDTMVTGNFALQTNVVKDSLTIQVWPVNWAARPGFPFAYMVRFENAGTTNLASSVVLQYDADRLNYDSVSNPSVLHNGNLLNVATGNLAPGQGNQFVAYFRVKPTVVIGDSLLAEATISNSNLSVTTNNRIAIRGSFDPNDKQATPQLSPSQVASGEYIDYTIRFQNTGTDTAFNIVITDTINNQLQVSTLQILATSHPCKTTLKNGIVYFEFLNVLLEDSNHNEPKSHGFVRFKIKPIFTVATNSGIPNKAAIYFDYNAPVITNTATTLIRDYVVLPLHLVVFSAVPQPDNTSRLEWITTDEVNCRNFVIEQSTNGYHFTALTSIPAKGSYSNNYSSLVRDASGSLQYYRLKMMDNDGRSTYSPIVKIDRRKNGQGFSILTNPVKDAMVLNNTNSSLNNTTCSMINSHGAVVKRFIIRSGNQRIDTRELPAGIYYLKTAMGSSKIIIQ